MNIKNAVLLVLAAFILAASFYCQQRHGVSTAVENNKALVRRLIDEAWNNGNLTAVDEILSADYTLHINALGARTDLEGYKQAVRMYHDAFSDFGFTVDDMVAEGDKVVIRWTIRGTHTSEYMGMAATGKDVMLTGISIRRIENGKISEEWVEMDRLGMMQQMGVDL